MKHIILYLFVPLLLIGCKNTEQQDAMANNVVPAPTSLQYAILKLYPHDTSSYTQGLFLHNNVLYEGTGWNGQSKLMTVDINTGKPIKKTELPYEYFGEGITLLNNSIYQLTWQNHKVIVYDATTFKKTNEMDWPYEGWGLTNNGSQLIISTGGSNLYFVNPATMKIERTLGVSDNNGYIDSINELEWVNGYIYANKYMSDLILKINPQTGNIEGKADLTNLMKESGSSYDPRTIDAGFVLNGIAYNPANQHFLITGKRWPFLAEITFK
jgi:glutamine cyclotransferase